jgi:hypothetical protein
MQPSIWKLRCLSLVLSLAFVSPLFPTETNATTNMIQATQWQITKIGSDTRFPSCSAIATFTTFPLPATFSRYSFIIGINRKGTLHEILAEPFRATHLIDTGSSPIPPFRPEFHDRRAWFDDEPAFTVHQSVSRESVGIVHGLDWDLSGAGELVARFSRNTRLTFETEDSGVKFRNGQPVRIPARTETVFLAGNMEVSAAIEACVEAVREGRPFAEVNVPAEPLPLPHPLVLQERLEQAEIELDIARNTSTTKEVVGLVLSRLGNLQADALRLGEAKVSLSAAVSALRGINSQETELRQTEDRLIEVLLDLEQLQEAEKLTEKSPKSRQWVAAIAVRRGEYDIGSREFLSLIADDIGASIQNFNSLKDLANGRDPSLSPDQTRLVRQALLAWGRSALGQEDMTPDLAKFWYGMFGAGVPAFALGEAVFDWIDPGMLRRGAAPALIDQVQLGQAAFLRGESLRRAGFLESVETDLSYAQSEMGQADGWQYRAQIALLALSADRGHDLEALPKTLKLLEEIGKTLGAQSFAWAEAASLVSALQLRNGDIADAHATADNAAAVAAKSLGPGHSLTMQLHLRAAEALLAHGDGSGAVLAAGRSIGLAELPNISEDDTEALWRKLKETDDVNRKIEIISAALGLQLPRNSRPVLQRKQRIHAARVLKEAISITRNPAERRAAETLSYALQMEEVQLRRNAFAQGTDLALEQTYGFRGRIRSYPDNPDRRVMATQPAGVWATAELLKFDAEKLIAPDALMPSDRRLNIPPGQDFDALELLLRDLRTLPGQPVQKGDRISLALTFVQAAMTGDVLAILATRSVAYSERGIDRPLLQAGAVNMGAAAEAAAVDVFQRRLRGMVQNLSADSLTDNVELRRRYFQLIANGLLARALTYNAFGTRFTAAGTYLMHLVYEATAEDFRARLSPQEAVVIWVPFERTTQAFVIRSDASAWIEIPEGRVALAKRISTIRGKIEEAATTVKNGGSPPLSEYPADDAYALFHTLFGQIDEERYLAGIDHIYTAQLGITGGLPLDLLVVEPPQAGQRLAWLGNRWAVTRMPTLISPAVFDKRRAPRPQSAPRLLAIGAPILEPCSSPSLTDLYIPAAGIRCLPPLSNADREMREVAESLHIRDLKNSIISGANATYATVLNRLRESNQEVLMFSTHGLVRDGIRGIDEPALVLTPPVRRGKVLE